MPRQRECRQIESKLMAASGALFEGGCAGPGCHLCCRMRSSQEEVVLFLDELEAIRLADLEGLYQEAAARSMGISRQTFGRIIEGARRKLAQSVLEQRPLRVESNQDIVVKEKRMKKFVALPTRDGSIDAHFGHCDHYTVYELEGNAIVSERRVDSPQGCGCKSNIASVLAKDGVSLMIAGNMGDGAVRVLSSQGIEVIRGIEGSTRSAVEAWMSGTLADSGIGCSAHGDDHECSNH